MTGLTQTFIKELRAETEVQYPCEGTTGVRWQSLHLAQSLLDSACGLCSFLQCMLTLAKIPRSQVERLTRTSRDPLRRLWDAAEAHYFAGTNCRDIELYASAFGAITTEIFNPVSAARLGSLCQQAIADGGVPMLWFETRTFGHWATVVGTESRDGKVSAVLALDPASPGPKASFFNARLELLARRVGRAKSPYLLPYRFIDGTVWMTKPRALIVLRNESHPP